VVATEVPPTVNPPRKQSTDTRPIPLNDTYCYDDDDSFNQDDLSQDYPEPVINVTSIPRAESVRELLHALSSRRGDIVSPTLERRLQDFHFAQKKRREKYGGNHPWGILGLYEHLNGVRTDVEWAEDAAWRRENNEPYLSWTDFDKSRNTGLNRPFFTYIFMIICTVFLILSFGLNKWKMAPISSNPMIGPDMCTLIRLGAKSAPLIFEDNEWWRLVSPMVLHAGFIHYALNMLTLLFIGKAIEQSHGFFVTASLFVVTSFGGTILSTLFLKQGTSVGASGGIFGLMGMLYTFDSVISFLCSPVTMVVAHYPSYSIGACLADITLNWNLLFGKEINTSDKGARIRHTRVLLWLAVEMFLHIITGLTPMIDNFMRK
jgi:membrane associated rhomboid family serine protease